MIMIMTKSSEHFPTTVDEYLATVPDDVHKVLQELRHTIKSIVPEAEERIAYRIPIFRLQRDLVGFSAQTNPQKTLLVLYYESATSKSDEKRFTGLQSLRGNHSFHT
jgi:hypothetical protein